MLDIRWKQRFSNYERALSQLKAAVELSQTRELSDLEKQGLIQSFEYTHELAWNVLKDYLEYQGVAQIIGSRDASREAFAKGIISDGTPWMEMIQSRNKTSHTYNKAVANEIVDKIIGVYFAAFNEIHSKFTGYLQA